MGSPDKNFQPASAQLRQLPPLAYGRLRQRHPDYDSSRMEELHDLYSGGYTIQRRADKYLTKVCNEHPSRYDERCKTTAYLGYFGQVVEQFTSDLFAQPLSIMAPADADDPSTPGDPPDAFYKVFETDSDLRGTAFVDLIKSAMTSALVQRTAFVCVDAKAPDDARRPSNRAEEDADGLSRLYAYEVSPREVIDWSEDDRGGFVWVIVNSREQDRKSPLDARDMVSETFTIWTREGPEDAEPRACWRRYQFTYPADRPPQDRDTATPAGEGTTSFKRIPLMRLELPKGLWVGNAIGLVQKEHWQRRSCLNGAQSRSMAAIPYIARGPEIGAVGGAQPSETQEDPHRGANPMGQFNAQGFVEIGSADKLDFAEPEGRCYVQVAKELDELKDEIFRVTHMMAASVRPSAGMMGRSAQSKQQDGKATALVLRALGKEARAFALAIYRTIAEGRGEDVHWVANGLDNYEVVDREQILAESVQLDLVDVPSETFAKTHATQVAEKLLTGVDPQTLDTIRKEIEKGVKDKFAQRRLEADARQSLTLDQPDVAAPTE